MMKVNDAQLARLPLYARDEIESLRRKVVQLQDELKAQQMATPTKVKWGWGCDLIGESFGYLKDDETIFFSVPRGRYMSKLRVSMIRDGSGVNLNADGTLMIECASSNDVKVRLKP